jgi:hypothetical protein
MFPPWERYSIGFLINSLFISFGILYFVLNFVDCLSYLDSFRDKLIEDLHSNNVITSTTAKILLYNIFDQKILNFNYTGTMENLTKTTLDLNSINNLTIGYNESNYTRRDYVIFDILVKLYRPVLFLCVFVFAKVIIIN